MSGTQCLRPFGQMMIVALLTFTTLALGAGVASAQATADEKELIAVLDMDIEGGSKAQASAITERLREELLRSGKFTLVDRSQLEAVLNEQALQQTGCTSQECAVQVGQILGIRKIVPGKITKLSEELWQVSAQLIDVETAQTLRAETVVHEGEFVTLLTAGVADLASKLTGVAVSGVATLRRGSGSVFLTSSTKGAEIFLDGRAIGQQSDALLENIAEGEHTVTLKKGNLAGNLTFTVKKDQLNKIDVKMEIARAQILISSNPFGANVSLDGVSLGVTPLQTETTAGAHRITVTLDSHMTVSADITVELERQNKYEAVLKPAGTLVISGVTPQHRIQIDGKLANNAALSGLLLEPGTYPVNIARDGFNARQEDAVIQAGATTQVSANLLPVMGSLTVRGAPRDAQLTINGGDYAPVARRSITPLQGLPLPIGKYEIVLEAARHTTQRLSVQVRAGQETVQQFTSTEVAQWADQYRREQEDAERRRVAAAELAATVREVEIERIKSACWSEALWAPVKNIFRQDPMAWGFMTTGDILLAPGLTASTFRDRSRCLERNGVTVMQQAQLIAVAYDRMQSDIARGDGEHLQLLTGLMGCPAQARDDAAALMQRHYEDIYAEERPESWTVVKRLNGVVLRDPVLGPQCVRAG